MCFLLYDVDTILQTETGHIATIGSTVMIVSAGADAPISETQLEAISLAWRRLMYNCG